MKVKIQTTLSPDMSKDDIGAVYDVVHIEGMWWTIKDHKSKERGE